jgi:hypothetical protein
MVEAKVGRKGGGKLEGVSNNESRNYNNSKVTNNNKNKNNNINNSRNNDKNNRNINNKNNDAMVIQVAYLIGKRQT